MQDRDNKMIAYEIVRDKLNALYDFYSHKLEFYGLIDPNATEPPTKKNWEGLKEDSYIAFLFLEEIRDTMDCLAGYAPPYMEAIAATGKAEQARLREAIRNAPAIRAMKEQKATAQS